MRVLRKTFCSKVFTTYDDVGAGALVRPLLVVLLLLLLLLLWFFFWVVDSNPGWPTEAALVNTNSCATTPRVQKGYFHYSSYGVGQAFPATTTTRKPELFKSNVLSTQRHI